MESEVVGSSNNIRGNNYGQEANKTRRHLNAQSLEIVESETLDDNTTECTENAIRGDSCEDHGGINPSDRIQESFSDVRPFYVVICDSGIVLAYSFESDVTLPVVEHVGTSGIVGQHEENENTPCNCTGAREEIDVLPSDCQYVFRTIENTRLENR